MAHHIAVFHKPDTDLNFLCKYCPKRYFRKSELDRHEETHTRPKNMVKCEECNRNIQEDGLLEHMESVHFLSGNYFPCSCAKVFGTAKALRGN